MSDGWVTPKNIVKKRRKSSLAKFHQSKSIVDRIERENQSSSQEKENVQKFNPFSSKGSQQPKINEKFEFRQNTATSEKIVEEKTDDFFNALSDKGKDLKLKKLLT